MKNNFITANSELSMSTVSFPKFNEAIPVSVPFKKKRIESIDLLRGTVMIIMALDHVRDYFHKSAFMYDPTDLSQTSVFLFFTRWITHFCAPIFVFLAGISAYLYGIKKSRQELSYYLLTRGIWLVLIEIFIITLGWTFNPSYKIVNLQVIWAIGISMIALSAIVRMNKSYILLTAIVLIAGHNLLDTVHVPGTGFGSFFWSFLHDPGNFVVGHFKVLVRYPVIPWIGIMSLGYYIGRLYNSRYDAERRRKTLFLLGATAIVIFFFLRFFDVYGDAAHWSLQKNNVFSFLSLMNVTKYPPSLLYTLMTLGPAMIFLAIAEEPLNKVTNKISVFGRVPFFYYVAHIYMIHLIAIIGAAISGYGWSSMILADRVNRVPELKGYGFTLLTVYVIWIGLVLFLYPFCKWYDGYKRANLPNKPWLSYI